MMAVEGKSSQAAEHKLAILLRSIVLSISITYLLGALFYADPFNFWEHALSELGTTRTLLGTPNLKAAFFVSVGMIISGGLLFKAGRFTMSHIGFMNNKIKGWFLFAASLGAFIAVFPNNKFHTIHSIGSALMIGPIFLMEVIMLWERKSLLGSIKVNLIIILLAASVLTYAVAFFTDAVIKQASQKICVINLLLVLIEGSHYLHTIGEPSLTPYQVN
jgi:hypothetical protein